MKLIDLHLHIDGAISVPIARKLAVVSGISLPESDDELSALLTVPKTCASLNDFLKCFELPLRLMQTKEAVEEASYLVCQDLKAQGLVYAELRFAPQLHLSQGLTMKEVVLSALKGMKRSGLSSNLILCAMRGEANEDLNLETVRVAPAFMEGKEPRVVAIDLAGAEGLYPTENFENVFKLAKELNVPFTIHAGEAAGPKSVWTAINFGAKRIGHGINGRFDDKLIEKLANEGIAVEMCPSSNIITKAITSLNQFPIKKYLEKGVKVTINTDDPAIVGTDIATELKLVQEKFKLTEDEMETIYRNGVDASFADELTKKSLIEKIADFC